VAQFIKNRFVKITLWVFATILIVFIALAVAIQIPYVQTKVINKLSGYLSEKTGFATSIGHVSIDWFDQIRLDNIIITDLDHNQMASIGHAELDYQLGSLIDDVSIHFDELNLDSAHIYLTKHHINDSVSDININILIRRIKELSKRKNGTPKLVKIGSLDLKNSKFRYHNPDKDSLTDRFDYNHFELENISATLIDFRQRKDTVTFSLNNLNANDPKSRLQVDEFQTHFFVSQRQMIFDSLLLKINNSVITNRITMAYESTRDLSDFNNLVNLDASFKKSTLYTDDLAIFAPALASHHQKLNISGKFKGRVSAFTFSDFSIAFNGNNSVYGKITMYGLPNLQETFIDLKVSEASIDASRLKAILKPKTFSFLSAFGRTRFNGKFIGYINDFVADGDFHTQMGKITSDLNLKVADEIGNSRYSGHLEMLNFDLGKYSGKSLFQFVTLNGEIKGKGLNFKTADFALKGKINKIGIKDYEYQNINTDARFAEEFFEGTVSVDDPNLKLSLNGAIDLRDEEDSYKATLKLEKALFKPINLSKYDIELATEAFIDAKGLKLDSISGHGVLRNIHLRYEDNLLNMDSLRVKTAHNNANRTLNINSDIIDANLEGTYYYTTAIKSIVRLIQEYRLNLQNDQSELDSYYDNKISNDHDQFLIKYRLQLKDITPVFALFDENIRVSKNTEMEGIYSNGFTSILSINTTIDTLSYKEAQLYDLQVDLSTSKIADSTSVLAMGFVTSTRQKINNRISTENLLIESIWDDDQITFGVNVEQQKYNNSTSISGKLDFLMDTTVIHFDKSSINIFDEHWSFSDRNEMLLTDKTLLFKGFQLSNKDQHLDINGSFSNNPNARALFNFENINIGVVNPIINKDLAGKLNGFIEIKNYFNTPEIQSDVSIDSLYVDSFLVGDFYGKTEWGRRKESLKIKAYLDRGNKRTVNINGDYYPKKEQEQLDLKANFDQANINILEPFLEKFFTDIRGEASGVFKITGMPQAPVINGTGIVNDGNIKVNYLNTTYSFDGDFGFSKDKIKFTNINLQDALGSTAKLTGNILHTGFKKMIMDLNGNLTSFQILNTASSDNQLFYGQGFASGNIAFKGPVNNMTINASAKSTKGTKIYIPIGDTENIAQEDFINFTNFTSDSLATQEIDVQESIDLRGLTMNFDLDITPEAYCELIFDIKSGDIIRGRGNGQINLKIDTRGEFNMFGDYILDQGGYNFTLYNIINKEFTLLPNSKISWYGDPYQGLLDMNATYSQLASLSPLVDTTYQSIPAIRRGYPVDVELMLNGPLLSPRIDFDINVKDYPSTIAGNNGDLVYLEDVVTELEARISTDEHELNRQVFSLIVLRRFSPPQSFNTAGSIGNSVSEFISNQLSYWVSQVDENLEVDVDLGKLDDEAFNTFQLRLSYTFLNGRLRVTREGGFGNQDQNQDVSGIVGDWTVEYMLTPDGKLRAKMYNRTNYNALNNSTLNSTSSITTGFSLLHTQDFDTIKELLTNERKKQRRQQEKDNNTSKNALKEED